MRSEFGGGRFAVAQACVWAGRHAAQTASNLRTNEQFAWSLTFGATSLDSERSRAAVCEETEMNFFITCAFTRCMCS